MWMWNIDIVVASLCGTFQGNLGGWNCKADRVHRGRARGSRDARPSTGWPWCTDRRRRTAHHTGGGYGRENKLTHALFSNVIR